MKKLFSLILVLCMVTTACAAFAESSSLGGLFGSLMGGSESGESSLLGSLLGGSGDGAGLGSLLGGLMGGSGDGSGLGGLLGGLMGGSGDGAGLGGLFGGLMGGSEGGEADMSGLFSSLFGGAMLEEAATEAATEAAVEEAVGEAAVEEAVEEAAAAEQTMTAEEAAELEAFLSLIKEAKELKFQTPEKADAFYGTWAMKSLVLAGYELDIAALAASEETAEGEKKAEGEEKKAEGEEKADAVLLRLTEEVYDVFEDYKDSSPKAITASELKDGALTITYFDEGKPVDATFKLTEDGDLCMIQTEEEGGHAEAPTYVLFTKVV